MDVEILSWIFTESLIEKCFDISSRTVDSNGKQAVCQFINQLCGVDVGGISCSEDQCECLLGAITVCQ